MKYEVFDILGKAKLYAYIPENCHLEQELPRRIRPAVIVLPGGGYAMTSDREAEPIALQFLAEGMSVFVLRYSVMTKFPQALCETAEAIRLVRSNAAEWSIDPDRIAVCGFSAGGHLAGSIAVFWNHDFLLEKLGATAEEIRPNGAILCYPVISSDCMHFGSFQNLLQDDSETMLEYVSIEKQVTEKTPPCFLWHTFNDSVVPVENSLVMAQALAKAKVPFELHVWPKGPHGLALVTPETEVIDMDHDFCERAVSWIHSAACWLREI